VVPSRHNPGKFYALPQSPQQYKQLLMNAGFERYVQIARAIRDEDLRADRGYEHTQIDVEMSFVERDDVMHIIEEMITTTVEAMGFTIKTKPFPVITYAESMEKYGDDKFDLRTDEDKENGILAYAWVVDFPFFEKTDKGGWTFSHNPFSAPKPEFMEDLVEKKNIGEIVAAQYDIVLNGFEIGGGGIRNHKPENLKKTFEIMGHSDDSIDSNFGHMLKALGSGTPPHGGIAYGFDRIMMILQNEPNIREVIAFAKTGEGRDLMTQSPSEISDDQKTELGIRFKKE
jgi:aspartyl-tRNA synthetase